MKLVKNVMWDIFNWDDLSYIYCENHRSINCYATLKSGKVLDFIEVPHEFSIETDNNQNFYNFCEKCCSVYVELYIKDINNSFKEGYDFYNMEENEDRVWSQFYRWAEIQVKLQMIFPKSKNTNNF